MNKKRNKIILISTFLLLSVVAVVLYFTKISYSYVAEDSTYRDFRNLPSAIPTAYSYSTWFVGPDTSVKIIQKPTLDGTTYDPQQITIAGKRFYQFGWETDRGFDGGEVKMVVKNSAVDANGNYLDVVFRVYDINKWSSDAFVSIGFYDEYLFMNDQDDIDDDYYSEDVINGNPIIMWLHAVEADVRVSLTYCKKGTVNESNGNCTIETSITNINSLYHDLDVPTDPEFRNALM